MGCLVKATVFASIVTLTLSAAQASESLNYNCPVDDITYVLVTEPELGRATYTTPQGTHFLSPDQRGDYSFDPDGMSFSPETQTIYFGDAAFPCQISGAASNQTHANGALGGNEKSLNMQGQSLGGKLRNGPGLNFSQIGSLPKGTWITLVTDTGIQFDGYHWFEVALDNGQRGYQWGGIMCSNGQRLPGIFEQCGARKPVVTPVSTDGTLNVQGQSLGGKLRAGPGTQHRQIGSVAEGTWITILSDTGVRFDGYAWFEVTLDNGQRGFQWGGIMCSNGQKIAGIYQQCGARPQPRQTGNNQANSGGGWMAFALAPGGAYGHGAAPSREGAERFAINYCGQAGCKIADTTQAKCHALARDGGISGIGAGGSVHAARDFAVDWCQRYGGRQCHIEYNHCQ